MNIDVNKLIHTLDSKLEFNFEMDLSDLTFGAMSPVDEPVIVEGLLKNIAGVLTCHMNIHTILHPKCDRCLEVFDLEKSVVYDCVLAEERQLDEDEDIILVENYSVDMVEIARTAFILEMDTKFVCSEDCKGLCFGCGVNLNKQVCRCKKAVDPRLAALEKLLEKNN